MGEIRADVQNIVYEMTVFYIYWFLLLFVDLYFTFHEWNIFIFGTILSCSICHFGELFLVLKTVWDIHIIPDTVFLSFADVDRSFSESNLNKSWYDAQNYCQNHGSKLKDPSLETNGTFWTPLHTRYSNWLRILGKIVTLWRESKKYVFTNSP